MRWQVFIPIASIVSSMLAVSVMWWSWQRRKEREAYYRYELSRLMLERFADDRERIFAWLRDLEAAERRRMVELMRIATWVLLFGGVAVLFALRFESGPESIFGLLPIALGAALAVYLFFAGRATSGATLQSL